MNYDFDSYRYFGHATSADPENILEEGLYIYDDIYGSKKLSSTTTEIMPEDIENGESYLVNNVFSVGSNIDRKYLIIVCYDKEDTEIYSSNLSLIDCQNIVGYYDESAGFYYNRNCYLDEEISM